jgi:hypothetical protein
MSIRVAFSGRFTATNVLELHRWTLPCRWIGGTPAECLCNPFPMTDVPSRMCGWLASDEGDEERSNNPGKEDPIECSCTPPSLFNGFCRGKGTNQQQNFGLDDHEGQKPLGGRIFIDEEACGVPGRLRSTSTIQMAILP